MTCELSIISLTLELIKKSVNGPAVELKTSVNFAFFFKRKLNFGFMPENIFQSSEAKEIFWLFAVTTGLFFLAKSPTFTYLQPTGHQQRVSQAEGFRQVDTDLMP